MADLRLLESFCAVMEAGSVQRAALELGYAQPTITLRIQQLEEQSALQLFERKGKRLVATDAARMLFDRAKHLLDQVRALEQDLTDAARGEAPVIRFGACEPSMSARITPVLAQLKRRFPKARIVAEFGGTFTFAQRVVDGSLDFAICPASSSPHLAFTPLYEESVGVLMPLRHPLAEKTRLALRDLAGQQIIYSESHCSYRALFQNTLDRRGILTTPEIEIASIPARIRAVQCGMGIAIMPYGAVERAPERTRFRELDRSEARLSIGILRREDAPQPGTALRLFFDMLRENARAQAARAPRKNSAACKAG